MVRLQGYNREKEEYVKLLINDDGMILGTENWQHIQPGSMKRFTGKYDTVGNLLYEDDEILSVLNGLKMKIRYGEYEAWCPEDRAAMPNIGFYVEAEGCSDMPLGEPGEYARLIRHADICFVSEKTGLERTIVFFPNEECIHKLSKVLAGSESCPCDVGLNDDAAYCDEGRCKECWMNAFGLYG